MTEVYLYTTSREDERIGNRLCREPSEALENCERLNTKYPLHKYRVVKFRASDARECPEFYA